MGNETPESETIVEEEVEVQENPDQTSEIKINGGDDMSELFTPPSREDADMQVDDLVRVDEEDVFGEGGEDMDDLTGVTREDIMGDEDPWGLTENTLKPPSVNPTSGNPKVVRRIVRRYPPEPSMGGIRT